MTKKKAAPPPPAPRYEVRHCFAHAGVLIGPWNADRASALPRAAREEAEGLGYLRPIPDAVTPAPAVAPEPAPEE